MPNPQGNDTWSGRTAEMPTEKNILNATKRFCSMLKKLSRGCQKPNPCSFLSVNMRQLSPLINTWQRRCTYVWGWYLHTHPLLRCFEGPHMLRFHRESSRLPKKRNSSLVTRLPHPRRSQHAVASCFLCAWEEHAMQLVWQRGRQSIPEYGNSDSVTL